MKTLKSLLPAGKYVVLFAIAIISFYPIIGTSSIFNSKFLFPPDSLDWIFEGRYLWSSQSEVLPVLRNPGFVWISATDKFFGYSGFAFAAANFIGLFLQWLTFFVVARWSKVAELLLLAFLCVYFLLPIHYVSTMPLSDSFATGTLMIGIALIGRGIQLHNFWLYMAGVAAALVSSLCQIYGLVAIAVAIATCIMMMFVPSLKRFRLRFLGFLLLAFTAGATFFSVKVAWEQGVLHEIVPTQIGLLQLGLEMLGFYAHVWLYDFAPLLIILLSVTPLLIRRYKSQSHASSAYESFPPIILSICGMFLLVISFFYNWPESRFSYSYVGMLYASGMVVVSTATFSGDKSKQQILSVLLIPFVSIAILLGVFMAPSNFWALDFRQIAPGHVWATNYGKSPNQFGWIQDQLDLRCNERNATSQNTDWISPHTELSPYQASVIKFGVSNCLK